MGRVRKLKLTRVECPSCGHPLVSKQREEDLLFVCDCGTIHMRDPKPKEVEYQIARPRDARRPDNVYVPFWRVSAHVSILGSEVVGGYIHRLATLIEGGDGRYSGSLDIYIPATKLPAEEFRKWAVAFTNNPPRYAEHKDFGGISRMPCNISKSEAEKLADFVILTNEAEKPGTLQYIQYTMTVNNMSLVFLPFIRDSTARLYINL